MGLVMRVYGLILISVFVMVARANSQISPGELHRSHAFLEGIENCTKCHGSDQQLAPDKCMACHGRIQAQRQAGKGLHSRPEYQVCQTCHVEHQGRDFKLIYWKDGEAKFNHSLTGFALEGKHATLQCRNCHQPKLIRDLTVGPNERIDSSTTYLGMSTTCLDCHKDEHKGQLSSTCINCHSQTAWKPAEKFNHATAKYPLSGKHITVPCAKCHQLVTYYPTLSDSAFTQYTGLNYTQCTGCHTDAHTGRLGTNCSSCHTTESWFRVSTTNFDHSKTKYPLEGLHASVECAKCHKAGEVKTALRFGSCQDCHSDYHRGQFAKRDSKGKCEECHTVYGYSPARFVMAQHDKTDYPLLGAHRAVPCMACHASTGGDPAVKTNFAFASTRCNVCHKDPHRGQVDKMVAADGCELCHRVESWASITYDHSKSAFALEGRHTQVACLKCHADIKAADKLASVKFTGVRKDCQSCHTDNHQGQFASANVTECSTCHSPLNWKSTKFDHKNSRFPLDGAHRTVACNKCHLPVAGANGSFVRYKPLEMTCAACHGTTIPERSNKS